MEHSEKTKTPKNFFFQNSSKKLKVSANPLGLLAENTSKKGWPIDIKQLRTSHAQ